MSASPHSSYRQLPLPRIGELKVPPVHGFPLSGNGMSAMPHALLLANRLFMTVSLRAPVTVIPVPTGPVPAAPTRGTFGLLLSCTKLCMNTQQEWVWVIGLMPLPGHAPFCGGGLSPFWLLVSNPSLLLSNSEFFTTSRPPELDPE